MVDKVKWFWIRFERALDKGKRWNHAVQAIWVKGALYGELHHFNDP